VQAGFVTSSMLAENVEETIVV